MSRHNKANKNNYTQAGRLTPDDMARERMKQAKPEGRADDRVKGLVNGRVSSDSSRRGEPESTPRRNEPAEEA